MRSMRSASRSVSPSAPRSVRLARVSCFCVRVSLGWRSCLGSAGSLPELELLPSALSLDD